MMCVPVANACGFRFLNLCFSSWLQLLTDAKQREAECAFGHTELMSTPTADALLLLSVLGLSYMLWMVMDIIAIYGLTPSHGRTWACATVAAAFGLETAVLLFEQQ